MLHSTTHSSRKSTTRATAFSLIGVRTLLSPTTPPSASNLSMLPSEPIWSAWKPQLSRKAGQSYGRLPELLGFVTASLGLDPPAVLRRGRSESAALEMRAWPCPRMRTPTQSSSCCRQGWEPPTWQISSGRTRPGCWSSLRTRCVSSGSSAPSRPPQRTSLGGKQIKLMSFRSVVRSSTKHILPSWMRKRSALDQGLPRATWTLKVFGL
mmetsp:Transcript_60477/g.141658  ORF Transcript_60477/g.141658 Transcript_60477/m.141658 type:complete len:209 (-) Transcript_60477:1176-1802(-)